MICEKCNNKIDVDSKFCSYCGNKVSIEQEKTLQIEQSIEKVEFEKANETISDNNETKVSEKQNDSTFKEFYFSNKGAIGRKEFFFRGFLPLTMILFILMAIPNVSLAVFLTYFHIKNEALAPAGFIKFLNYAAIGLYIFLFIISIIVSAKRLQDANKADSWALLLLIPLINIFLLLFLFFAPSKKNNIYGIKKEYSLNPKKILLSIFYTVMIFIMLAINGISKGIVDLNIKEKNISQEKNYTKPKEFNNTLSLEEKFQDGLNAYEKGDYKTALAIFEDLALREDANAQYTLGFMYGNGIGVKQDYTKAKEWYEKVASKGDAEAQYNLGLMYYNGEGVKQDYTKAIEWYEKAASQGYVKAQNNLGVMYENGNGVKQDKKIAKEWFGKACDGGSQLGCDEYKKLNQQGY